MKKFQVIGNPIKHSLSPEIHNYWIKNNNINAIYKKQKVNEQDLKNLISQMRNKEIAGINVTVPFKKIIIPYLDELTLEAKETQSVNTIYFQNDRVVGHNTDIGGFEISLQKSKYDIQNKNVFLLGAGGVAPSIIYALNKIKVSKIFLSNRTKDKAINLKKIFTNLNVIDWGVVPNFDIVINATSLGLNKEDKMSLDFSNVGKNKLFYDVIYNPQETNFLKTGKDLGNMVVNGKLMFIYQAFLAFQIWHQIKPEVNEEVSKLLDK
jgi:shikimate dehydrogenase